MRGLRPSYSQRKELFIKNHPGGCWVYDMSNFKYELQKWDGPKSRHVCPKCNQKTLVRFVDGDGNYVGGEDYGRCNREEKCGYVVFPSKGTLANVGEVLKPIPKLETDYLKGNEMIGFRGDCHLKSFLRGKFENAIIDKVFDDYHVLTTDLKWIGSTVFYQIDEHDRVRTAKIMDYDHEGKRVKKPYNRIYWIHRLLDRDFNMQQCLFGAHLINEGKPIGIVESEKTAIICAMNHPEMTFVATGGLQGVTKEKMKPLDGLDVRAYPDKGAYNKWEEIFSPYPVKVSGILEDILFLKDGQDIADYILQGK